MCHSLTVDVVIAKAEQTALTCIYLHVQQALNV
jgi:hypothetical protein